jgi:hypothetical protein
MAIIRSFIKQFHEAFESLTYELFVRLTQKKLKYYFYARYNQLININLQYA